MKQVLLLINSISENPSGDELDVLVQAEAIETALDELGLSHTRAYCSLNLQETMTLLEKVSPDNVFNLVETLGGKGSLIHLPASLLESSGIPFTGSPGYTLFVTTDKVRTKRILKEHHLPTPGWIQPREKQKPDPQKRYILKPVWEDGSAGITDASVVDGTTLLNSGFTDKMKDNRCFLEEYIDGREFNITLLAGPNGPEVMPAAEMLYLDYPEGKPKILNFASKWEPGSFEYEKTVRTFETSAQDRELVVRMGEISLKCWEIFELRGYARVDFRVDPLNQPFVLEVNANPCISPDAGFVAACAEKGLGYTRMIERILMDVNLPGWKT